MTAMEKDKTNQSGNRIQMLQIAVIALMLAALTIIHQIISWNKIWEWKQVIHHETIVVALISFSIGILITLKCTKK